MAEAAPFVQQNVHVNSAPKPKAANMISTVKYTWYTWLPKSLWDQFRRIANAYFLLISILMLVGTYATYLYETPLDAESTVVTLIVVLLITSFKELFEDLERGKSDKFENTRMVKVITFDSTGNTIETEKESKMVNPGEIIKLEGTKPSPVDMLLILTSMYDDGNKCYIETANIDGETNLKVREAPPALLDVFKEKIASGKATPDMFQGTLSFEPPNKNIHNFVGTFDLDNGQSVPLAANNIILRSALFSNTDWCYGIAVYCGQQTKIQMNNRHAPSKMSKIEALLNKAIVIIFIAQVVLVIISVISIYALGYENEGDLPYVYPSDSGDGSILPLWLEQFFVFFLLYNNFIPISLYVTIELVNLGQAFLVGGDGKMYREELDVACKVKASNLVQELGMVSNVFSDKTGTLTRNEMNLVKFVINGTLYDIPMEKESEQSKKNAPTAAQYMERFGANKDAFYNFFRCLTTCHTVVREKNGTYRAESPDELALVEGAGQYRCGLLERGSKEMIVNIFGERTTYEVLAVNPFNADRKRMSLLIKDTVSNKYFCMCKGADNIMYPLCRISEAEKDSVDKSLLELANYGLRTLIIAHKELSERDAQAWLTSYKAAQVSVKDREAQIAAVGAKLEVDMALLGITAIEDRLQDEVPEVIADLTTAGIIVWMLTGDKLETAINIGRSCNLLLPDTHLHMLSRIQSPEAFASELEREFNAIVANNNPNAALVLDGPSFLHFDSQDPNQRRMLLRIGAGSRSVIACRLTPTQKRELVNLVKVDTEPQAITLAIGDGANDVSMILEGNVGVGIFGKEGRQAANNADFAIGEFKFLRRLLLVHGRWNYVRQARVFLYSMHKNMVLTLTLFWFSYFTAVSGTSLYQSWIYSSFNIALFLPIFCYGFMDRDLSEEFQLKYPQTYATGRTNVSLSTSAIMVWILNACLYAIVICLISYYALEQSFHDYGLYSMGTVVFVGMVMALQAKVAFFHHQWAWPHVLAMAISVGGMFIYDIVVAVTYADYWYVAQTMFDTPLFWLFGFFFIPLVVILIDVIGYYGQLVFMPTNEQLYRELEHEMEFDNVQMMTCISEGNGTNNDKAADSKVAMQEEEEENSRYVELGKNN
mmetsp:Transcript_11491/g.18844  ORF Transcript_11491/g.18844 Transcript_11491/m.18844 type:complete len:1109 (-) Transcript_11491:1128-4454(-)